VDLLSWWISWVDGFDWLVSGSVELMDLLS